MSSAIAFAQNCALAQITTDGTLGPAQTLIKNGRIYNIRPELGQTVGSNLFQSFGIFNLNQDEIADFQSGSGIKNILARVTGGNPSVINGQMFTSSADVNLFFINPYGIIFGPNSSLDVGGRTGRGAFVATTVDAIVWPDGQQFSATNPGGASSLLTIVGDPGGFLASARTPGPISNLGGKLEVYDNQSLLLLGGNVTLSSSGDNVAELKATGGRVEIGAVGGAGRVDLNLDSSQDNALGFSDDVVRADILLTNGAKIDATTGQNNGTGTGLVRLLGRNISVTNGAELDASTFGQGDAGIIAFNATESVLISGQGTNISSNVRRGAQGNAGGIGIRAKSFFLTDGARLATSTFPGARGNSGIVLIQADQVGIDNSFIFSTVEKGAVGDALGIQIEANSISLTNNTELQTITRGRGDAGTINLQTNGGSIALDNSRIFSTVESGGVGKGGRIEIETGSLSLNNGAQLQTIVRGGGRGDPGIIYVKAADSVSLAGISPTDGNPSGIFSVIGTNAQGGFGSNQFAGGIFDAILGKGGTDIVGAIGIDTGSLSLTDGAQLNTSTDGIGNAGAVIVLARDRVSLTNGGAILSASGINAQGDSGAILMGVGSLSIDGTSGVATGLTTQTFGVGNAGLVLVGAERDISIKGNGSGIASSIEEGATGDSGGILIEARDLFITDGAELSVSNNNFNSGTAGDIGITARDVRLEDEGKITATTLSGDGGNIAIEARDLLVLTNTSNISTQAGRADAGGNGGNIGIKTQYIFAAPVKNSNIVAQAYTGNGGSIGVTAAQLYKIAPRPEVQLTNDIDASSRYGQDGLVTTNVLNVDPTQGLNSLSENPVDPSRLIAQQCAARSRDSGEENKFVVIGRGGLPANPNNTLQNESVVTDWVGEPPQENPSENNNSANPDRSFSTATTSAKPSALVEAQGWVIGEKGEIILTANAPTVIPHDLKLTPDASCNGS
jgi:filamentous hemagglutinin family protein